MIERLERQMEFILEIDKLKKITRQTYISDGSRKENDTEHSWHLAMMCLLLSEYANEDIDVMKVMSMVLIHDIIEIDAGDTYAYDNKGNSTKIEREIKAAERIFNILPKDQAVKLRSIWDEFEANITPEARFARTLDNIQPVMLNNATEGISWKEHNVMLSQILNRNKNTHKGSEELWNFSLYRNILPNVKKNAINYDKENVNFERFELVYERIMSIEPDSMIMPEKFKDYFVQIAAMFNNYYNCCKWVWNNNYRYAAPIYKWYKEISHDKWKEVNKSVTRFRFDSDYYLNSYANPKIAVNCFGKELGQLLSYLAAQVSLLGQLCFEERYFELTIFAELFLEIYGIFENCDENLYEGEVKSAIYYFIYDYMDDVMEYKVRDSFTTNNPHFVNILNNIDVTDVKSLYMYGENIGINEIGTFSHLASLDEDKITELASTFVNGYIESFRLEGIDLSEKETVQIRYPIGFERIVIKAIQLFKENGLDAIVLRNCDGRMDNNTEFTGCIDSNPSFIYTHRMDKGLYYNKAIMDRQINSLRQAFEKYKTEAAVYAGPAVIEHFGEQTFEPEICKEAIKLDENQQKLIVEYSIECSNITNEFIPKDKYSFTIIAFPVPEIGKDYSGIFDETVRINTLDSAIYSDIQQDIIEVLDACKYISIIGKDDNKTNINIYLADITNDNQTRFHNCLADCNIPLGEVYTSPKLMQTTGVLNVNNVYINELLYKNLVINFKDGMVVDYNCSNYENEQDNLEYIRDNLMKQHKSLPMGEFAIGTNTLAYAMGKKYNISDKLPILIAEKTGPHIAIGDTCFSMSEDKPVYNPDGKEVIARDNELTYANRKECPSKAYFGCHTDITIPYNEIGGIYAVLDDGSKISIIEDGRFVLEGTQWLNNAFDY
ncbi:MAG: HD domain-containing protein [Lachnospiraceae bacterium]|nr:HD domain-containing protein [Lachnospiraceae bacterium]